MHESELMRARGPRNVKWRNLLMIRGLVLVCEPMAWCLPWHLVEKKGGR